MSMQEKIFFIGIALIFLGIFLTVISALISGKGKVEYGFGGFIGPIPFGWASNREMLYIIIAISLIMIILFLFYQKFI